MTLRKSSLPLVCGLALVSTVVEAQTGVSGPSSRFWAANFRFQQTISDNATFTSNNVPPQPDMVSRLGGGLAYTRVSDRSQLLFGGQGNVSFYRDSPQNNTFGYGVNFSGSYEFTPRTSFGFAQTLSQGYSRDSALLTDQGILLPLVLTGTATTSASLAHRLSDKTTVSGNVAYRRVAFADPAFRGGSTISAGVNLNRQLTTRDGMSVSYSLGQSRPQEGVPVNTHSLNAGWSRTANARINFGLGGGVSSSSRPGGVSPVVTLNASANLSALVARGVLAVNYSRGIRQTFGLGRTQLTDVLSARFSHPIGQRFSVSNSLTYRLSRDPVGVEFTFHSWTYSASGGYQLAREWSIGASYRYERVTDPAANLLIASNSVSFSITYGHQWQ